MARARSTAGTDLKMRSHGSLEVLSNKACRRLGKIRSHATALAAGARGPAREQIAAFVVVEAQNLWANFSRSFLLSLLKQPRRRSGVRAFIGDAAIATPGQVIHTAAMVAKGPHAAAPTSRREEPAWHDPSVLIKTCVRLRVSNLNAVQGALSIQSRVLHDMPSFRNFYAHRNEESAEKAVNLVTRMYAIPPVRHPTDALVSSAPRRNQCVLLDWLDELNVLIDLLCE